MQQLSAIAQSRTQLSGRCGSRASIASGETRSRLEMDSEDDAFCYPGLCAMVVVGGATVDFVRRSATMLIIGIVLVFVGLAYLCWLLFALAVHALPFFVGATAGVAAYHSGSGAIGAILVGAMASSGTLVIGQIAFMMSRSSVIRAAVALLFAMPAAVAGRRGRLSCRTGSCAHCHSRRGLATYTGDHGRDHHCGDGLGAHDTLRSTRCEAGRCCRSDVASSVTSRTTNG